MSISNVSLERVLNFGSSFGLLIDHVTAQRIHHYIELLCFWGRRINLTSRPDPQNILERHLPDAFQLAAALQPLSTHTQLLPNSSPLTCIDFGSGAGLPGIPLALCLPHLKLTLVEPNHKKCSFLKTACHELQLAAEILPMRMGQVALPPQDIACSRATWSPDVWLNRATAWVKPGGEIITFVAHLKELPLSPAALQKNRTLPYELLDGTPRFIVTYSLED